MAILRILSGANHLILILNGFILDSFDKFFADPFFVTSADENLKIIFEDYPFDDDYGKIALMTVDKDFRPIGQKLLLDTGSHLSYPFVFYENNKIYIFPEAARSSKLTCYEYDPVDRISEISERYY